MAGGPDLPCMADQSDIEVAEVAESHYRFRFQGRSEFEELTEPPAWVQEAAEQISEGATVRMGRLPDSDTLQVESVVVARNPNLGKEEARNVAERIGEEIRM